MSRIPLALLDPKGSDEDIESFLAALKGDAKRYSPDQPRVPAGSDKGGEWTDTGQPGQFAADLAEAFRYSPDQPRVPAGVAEGGQWTDGLIPPIASGEQVPAKGRQDILTDDPTRVENLPPEFHAKLVKQLQGAFPGMTEEELEANVLEQLDAGLADEGNLGATWYEEANKAAVGIAEEYGLSEEQGVGLIAAMSPQQEWGSNVEAARFTAKMLAEDPLVDVTDFEPALVGETRWQLAERDVLDQGAWAGERRLSEMSAYEAAAVIKLYARDQELKYLDDQNGKSYGVTWSCGLPGIAAGIEIARGGTPDDVLNGHKVRSFYNNILGGSESGGSVTVDTHAVSAALGQKVTAGDKRMGKIMGTPTSREWSTKGTYSLFASAYRRAAAKRGLSPEQAQAIVWLQWRKLND